MVFPLGLLLGYWSFYSLLPDGFQVGVIALVVILNGGLWYGLLRLCFRQKRPAGADATGGRAEWPPRAILAIRRFDALEWLWVGHTVLWLGAGFLFIATQDSTYEVAVTGLALPLCLPLLASPGYLGLDEGVRAPLFAVILFLNGGLWYGLMRLVLRRTSERDTPRSAGKTPLRAIGNFHRRWLRGELGADPVWAHLLMAPVILWMGLGVYHASAILFTVGAVAYFVLMAAVVIGEKRQDAALRSPRSATGGHARMDRPGWLRAQRTVFRIVLGLTIGLLVSVAYLAWAAPRGVRARRPDRRLTSGRL